MNKQYIKHKALQPYNNLEVRECITLQLLEWPTCSLSELFRPFLDLWTGQGHCSPPWSWLSLKVSEIQVQQKASWPHNLVSYWPSWSWHQLWWKPVFEPDRVKKKKSRPTSVLNSVLANFDEMKAVVLRSVSYHCSLENPSACFPSCGFGTLPLIW